jgi:hypothetical protein
MKADLSAEVDLSVAFRIDEKNHKMFKIVAMIFPKCVQ